MWWNPVNETSLEQGDLLLGCWVPVLPSDFTPPEGEAEATIDIHVEEADLIILTQSCDLLNNPTPWVVTAPVFTVESFEQQNPNFAKKGYWEQVRKGRVEGVLLLRSHTDADDPRASLVVSFREVYTLPFDYLTRRAEEIGERLRLRSPYVEYLAQGFARFFMRVALPADISKF